MPKSPETRKAASIAKLQARGIPCLDSLPVIEAADAARIRSAEEIARRAIACLIAIQAAFAQHAAATARPAPPGVTTASNNRVLRTASRPTKAWFLPPAPANRTTSTWCGNTKPTGHCSGRSASSQPWTTPITPLTATLPCTPSPAARRKWMPVPAQNR